MDYTNLSRKDLMKKCDELNLTKYKSKTKLNLIELLKINTNKVQSFITITDNINIMNIIEIDDRKLIENNRILNMSRIDWGKTMAVSNQYIQRNILRYMLKPFGYIVYSTDDKECPNINSNNSQGYDLVILSPENKIIRIQSKIRQVNGINDYSKKIHFETTRRNSNKNIDKNHTGHICYSLDEFDLVMITLVNDRINRNIIIKDCNLWSYSLIPIKELEDIEHNCCYSYISSDTLKKNIINMTDDIRVKF